ncbi:ExeM/NucH family extracellular endonuclease [Paracoccus tegillarcae]|nr:ExeM/NucH family extracellular endonuclease [Paracoccus tegillarcae]
MKSAFKGIGFKGAFGLPSFVLGNWGAKLLKGSDGRDLMLGLGGNDRLMGGGGDDTLLGGGGRDTAVYLGGVADYTVTPSFGNLVRVSALRGDEGTDWLGSIEALYFAGDDYTLHLDGRNNAAMAGDDAISAGEDGVASLSTAGLLANDREFDGDTLTIAAVSDAASGAQVTLQGDQILYDPGTRFDYMAEGETATDSFTYRVDDGRGGTDTATVTVTISGANDAPVLSVTPAVEMAENETGIVAQISATDIDSAALTYAISGGADAALFQIDADTGALSFVSAPDYENPTDAGGDNIYDVTVSVADDQGGSDSADIAVTVTDVEETPAFEARINEFHYDNAGADTGEFIEVRVTAGGDASGLSIELYNGNGGGVYSSLLIADATMASDGTYDYYVWDLPANGLQNGAPDGLALINSGEVVEFLSYEGEMTADGGTADGLTSSDIGVSEAPDTEIGLSLQRDENGDWSAPATETKGAANSGGGDGGGGDEEATPALISVIQGSTDASTMIGQRVEVTAVVVHIAANGFYIQEEDADADGDALTSEGIFVYTGGGTAVALGDLVQLDGTVTEFNGLTELTDVSEIVTISSDNELPTAAVVELSPEGFNFESVEGMRVSVVGGTSNPLTVIENFNLDRFGEIVISAGSQYQPTQLFDAQTEADQVAQLAQENANNRLIIEDGVSAQNPDSFEFLANNSAGDNGNGYIDAGDSFGNDGATLRLGAQFNGPIEGVITYQFGDFALIPTEQLPIDETTNSGARQETPDAVGGDLQVASINVLNYFTTLSGGTGPDGSLDPRGATSEADLARQTEKLVSVMTGTEAEVFALQEIENGGFGDGSAIDTLVDALNAEATETGSGAVYVYVDPTGAGGFVGDDAIMTGIIYDSSQVTLVHTEYLVFEEASADATYQLAKVLDDALPQGTYLEDYQRNRPSVAATFEDADGNQFTVVSSHFKSKGDSGLASLADAAQTYLDANGEAVAGFSQADIDALLADPNFDQGDGQAYWNGVRTDAAGELADWLETSYNGGGVTDYILLGDMNAYAQEDPVQLLRDQGLVDLIDEFIGQDQAYSYVFDGQRGTLDQGLASDGLADNVTGATEWHVNADEPDLLGYNSAFNDPGFYTPGPFAASDHDPLIVGLTLEDPLLA